MSDVDIAFMRDFIKEGFPLHLKIISILLLMGAFAGAFAITDRNIKEQIAGYNKTAEEIKEVRALTSAIKPEPESERPDTYQKELKPKIKEVTTPGEEKTITAQVTYYCACEKCTGRRPDSPSRGLTASGRMAKENHTVAAGAQYPFGTLLEIDGEIYEVEDRGGNIKGDKIDIYITNHQEALNKGSRLAQIKVIRWGR